MSDHWYFLNSRFCTPEENMACDIALAHLLEAEKIAPTFRIYGWNPPSISIGFHEREEDFDVDAIRRDGLGFIRRPTGGRAILHAEELTYSVVMPIEPKGPRGIYHWVNTRLLSGLSLLGVHGTLVAVPDDLRQSFREPVSVPCFAKSARSEIQVNGRKIVGSAQRRYGNMILQHGSLLLGPRHKDIARYYLRRDSAGGNSASQELDDKTIDVSEILGRNVLFEEAASAIRRGFSEGNDVEFSEFPISIFESAGVTTAVM